MANTPSLHVLAAGPGWRVSDVLCTAGAQDRPFAEQPANAHPAIVTAGTFQYRSSQGDATFVPGSLLLADVGSCFKCGHEHGAGDRCLAFHFTPTHLESIAAETPHARRASFGAPRLPPLPALMRL